MLIINADVRILIFMKFPLLFTGSNGGAIAGAIIAVIVFIVLVVVVVIAVVW